MSGLKRQRIMETHGSLGNKHESIRSIVMGHEHVRNQLNEITGGNTTVTKRITGNGNAARKVMSHQHNHNQINIDKEEF